VGAVISPLFCSGVPFLLYNLGWDIFDKALVRGRKLKLRGNPFCNCSKISGRFRGGRVILLAVE
jgi:hypothetical protein